MGSKTPIRPAIDDRRLGHPWLIGLIHASSRLLTVRNVLIHIASAVR